MDGSRKRVVNPENENPWELDDAQRLQEFIIVPKPSDRIAAHGDSAEDAHKQREATRRRETATEIRAKFPKTAAHARSFAELKAAMVDEEGGRSLPGRMIWGSPQKKGEKRHGTPGGKVWVTIEKVRALVQNDPYITDKDLDDNLVGITKGLPGEWSEGLRKTVKRLLAAEKK